MYCFRLNNIFRPPENDLGYSIILYTQLNEIYSFQNIGGGLLLSPGRKRDTVSNIPAHSRGHVSGSWESCVLQNAYP